MNGIQEVGSSILPGSTNLQTAAFGRLFALLAFLRMKVSTLIKHFGNGFCSGRPCGIVLVKRQKADTAAIKRLHKVIIG